MALQAYLHVTICQPTAAKLCATSDKAVLGASAQVLRRAEHLLMASGLQANHIVKCTKVTKVINECVKR